MTEAASSKMLVAILAPHKRRGHRRAADLGHSGYYYHDPSMPAFLLTLFAKGDKGNLSRAERNDLAGLVRTLSDTYGRKP